MEVLTGSERENLRTHSGMKSCWQVEKLFVLTTSFWGSFHLHFYHNYPKEVLSLYVVLKVVTGGGGAQPRGINEGQPGCLWYFSWLIRPEILYETFCVLYSCTATLKVTVVPISRDGLWAMFATQVTIFSTCLLTVVELVINVWSH